MGKVYLQDSTLTAIGNAIREKTNSTGLMLPSAMPAAIQSIKGGGGNPADEFNYYNLLVPYSMNYGLYFNWKDYFTDFNQLVSVSLQWGKNGPYAAMKEHVFTSVYATKACPANVWRINNSTYEMVTGKINFSNDGYGILFSIDGDSFAPSFSGSYGGVQLVVRK